MEQIGVRVIWSPPGRGPHRAALGYSVAAAVMLPDIDAASPAVADAWRLRNVTRESVEIPFSKITKALAAILAATVKTT